MKPSFLQVAWLRLPWSFLIATFFLLGVSPIRHDDVFMYLSMGREFFKTGGFPDVDPFIWSSSPSSWNVLHAPGGFLLYYLSFLGLGWLGLTLVKITAAALAWAPSFVAVWTRHKTSLLHYMIFLTALIAFSSRYAERTSLFGDMLVAFSLAVAVLDWQGVRRVAWSLPVILLVWVNLHGSFPLGWMICGLWLVSFAVAGDLHGAARRLPVFVVSLVVTLFNPQGLKGVMMPFQFSKFQTQFLREFILEWQPTFTSTRELSPRSGALHFARYS
jgi:hypothetical protein